MQLDIVDFYPSITEQLLEQAINFAKRTIQIESSTINVIKHARKSLLFANNSTWMKNNNELFDCTMGSYDGAEVCELVGLYLLSNMRDRFPLIDFGLYRDDGMGAYRNLPGPESERMKKRIIELFKENDLQITIDMCLSHANFLDVTFSLLTETYKPYRKPNSEALYINRHSNHPPTIIKQLPAMIEKRLSELSCNEAEFNHAKEPYNEALRKSGYTASLQFRKSAPREKSARKRNIIYFNPPFNTTVRSNIGQQFLRLVDKHFPPHNKYRKLFNRNTIKVSYSCSPSMNSIITNHNSSMSSKSEIPTEPLPCNCRNQCPMNQSGECRLSNIVYKATVMEENTNIRKEYIGISGTEFKVRYANHKQSFTNEKKRDATSLSQHVWSLKDRNAPFSLKWSVLAKCAPYVCGSRKCNLCITEKCEILKCDPNITLNKRNEIVGKCRHRAKFKLKKM